VAAAARAAKTERPYSAPGPLHSGRRDAGAAVSATADELAKEAARQDRSKEAAEEPEEALRQKEKLRLRQNSARQEALRKDWELLHAL
jgi:predicted Holliday junction resolvase-like endonuclease